MAAVPAFVGFLSSVFPLTPLVFLEIPADVKAQGSPGQV